MFQWSFNRFIRRYGEVEGRLRERVGRRAAVSRAERSTGTGAGAVWRTLHAFLAETLASGRRSLRKRKSAAVSQEGETTGAGAGASSQVPCTSSAESNIPGFWTWKTRIWCLALRAHSCTAAAGGITLHVRFLYSNTKKFHHNGQKFFSIFLRTQYSSFKREK